MTGVVEEPGGGDSGLGGAGPDLDAGSPTERMRREIAVLRARVADLEERVSDVPALQARLDEALRQAEERRQTGRALDREVVQLRSMLAEAERQMANIRQTFIYRIGEAIVSARTWKGLRQLPSRLIALRRAYLEKRGLTAPAGAAGKGLSERLRYVDESLKLLSTDGLDAALGHIRAAAPRDGEDKARALLEIAHRIFLDDPARAASLAVESGAMKSLEPRLRALVLALFDHGEVNAPALILATLGDVLSGAPADRARREVILAQERQLAAPLRFPPRAPPTGGTPRIAVLAPRSLPHQADADAYRAQSVCDAALRTGYDAVLITEPGFQYPKPGDGAPAYRTVGGRRLVRLPDATVPPGVFDRFVAESGALLAREFAHLSITHVHALGQPELAAASLWAAREAGATFTLDIGGVPAFGSHVDADWEGRERFRSGLSLFADTARLADRVFVRSAAVAAAFADRGLLVGAEIIPDVVPSDITRRPETRIADLRHAIGVTDQKIIGAFGAIDGDDGFVDLVRALPLILEVEPGALVLFAGSGLGAEAVRQRAVAAGVSAQVRMAADFPRFGIEDYPSASQLAVFPKRRLFAAGLTAPFELQIAMAVGAPIIAAQTAWAREWIDGDTTGVFADPGDHRSLADAVIRLLRDPDLAARLGARGRDLVRSRAGPDAVDPLVVASFGADAVRSAA